MFRKKILCYCAGAIATLAWVGAAQPASAQTVDQRTIFTFSGPVEMPGVTLPAGKFVFRLANPQGSRDVIQVLSNDGKKVYGMFFSIPVNRFEPPADPEVRFMEVAAGTPPAIKTYWRAGERAGREFIYPKEQARRLARTAKQPVLTTQAQTTTIEETKSGDLARMSSSGEESRMTAENQQTAAAPTGEAYKGEYEPSSTVATTGQVPAPQPTRVARAELPRTGSQMPLVGLIGLFFMTGATVIRFYRSRQV